MKFVLTINCENDAFKSDALYEVCRILTAEAAKMKRWVGDDLQVWNSTLLDSNGNVVGTAKLQENV